MVPQIDRWIGKVAIVTGASQGIGAAITEKLLDAGLNVVGLARGYDKLVGLVQKFQGKNGKFYPIKADVSKEDDLLKAFEQIKTIGPVHILINNAGAYSENGLLDGSTESWRETLDTNVLGLCIATREAIKDMRSNNIDGHIIHIGSIVYRLPNINVYLASKLAVNALTETLRQELNSIESKIRISCINPGTVRTPLIDPGTVVNSEMQDHYTNSPTLNPSDIAEAVAYILATPPHVQVHEMTIKPVGETI